MQNAEWSAECGVRNAECRIAETDVASQEENRVKNHG